MIRSKRRAVSPEWAANTAAALATRVMGETLRRLIAGEPDWTASPAQRELRDHVENCTISERREVLRVIKWPERPWISNGVPKVPK